MYSEAFLLQCLLAFNPDQTHTKLCPKGGAFFFVCLTSELQKKATILKFRIVQKESERNVSWDVDFYNLDAIIAVGYRVNSIQATLFCIWATKSLREFIIKGFV
jgi:hypothetical protein